jgi:ABC-2 type transport system ATP-binding protein
VTVLLRASQLTRRFGEVAALDGFDLEVGAGEIVGLVGHNGAGKTTFARAAAGLVSLDAGAVTVAGYDAARQRRQARRLLGLAPQELAIYPTATARENLLLFAGLQGLKRAEAQRRAEDLAGAMALSAVLDRRVRDLSGGQQRRLQAATAMIHRPPVLILDEPTVGADPTTREALLAVVRSAADDGAAVVYTTHYLPELDLLDATLAVASRGRIIARGPRAALLASVPGHAELMFSGPPPQLTLPAPADARICVEAERMTITSADPAALLASLISAHPETAGRLRAIDLRPPTLDDLYRSLVEP